MRVYQFMSAIHGLDNIRKKRVKVARITDLNDPFELLAVKVPDATLRAAVERWRIRMSEKARLLCFSKEWHNPVMWSHYGDKHKGVCLGFDVPDSHLLPVDYRPSRLEMKLDGAVAISDLTEALSQELLTTKFSDWEYEQEVRMFLRPDETYVELGLDFFPFCDSLQLKEVIIGPPD